MESVFSKSLNAFLAACEESEPWQYVLINNPEIKRADRMLDRALSLETLSFSEKDDIYSAAYLYGTVMARLGMCFGMLLERKSKDQTNYQALANLDLHYLREEDEQECQ